MESQPLGLANRTEFQYCPVMHAFVPTYLPHMCGSCISLQLAVQPWNTTPTLAPTLFLVCEQLRAGTAEGPALVPLRCWTPIGPRSQGPWVWPHCSRQVTVTRIMHWRGHASAEEDVGGPELGVSGVATLLTPGWRQSR